MPNLVIFGAGDIGKIVYRQMKDEYNVVAFVDNGSALRGKRIDNIPVLSPKSLNDIEYDFVVCASLTGCFEMKTQLLEMGIDRSKLLTGYPEISVYSRLLFLKRTAEQAYKKGLKGSVAEAGVLRGEFAKEINRYFPDRKCYLFDTFDGFDSSDIALEKKKSSTQDAYMRGISEQFVYDRMPNKEMVNIRKGYFPKTAEGLIDDFVFVNLDMDLYKPTYEGLVYFYPKLVSGGTLLVHDYFSEAYPNIQQALLDYENHYNVKLTTMPIGDDFSIAILKP